MSSLAILQEFCRLASSYWNVEHSNRGWTCDQHLIVGTVVFVWSGEVRLRLRLAQVASDMSAAKSRARAAKQRTFSPLSALLGSSTTSCSKPVTRATTATRFRKSSHAKSDQRAVSSRTENRFSRVLTGSCWCVF